SRCCSNRRKARSCSIDGPSSRASSSNSTLLKPHNSNSSLIQPSCRENTSSPNRVCRTLSGGCCFYRGEKHPDGVILSTLGSPHEGGKPKQKPPFSGSPNGQ